MNSYKVSNIPHLTEFICEVLSPLCPSGAHACLLYHIRGDSSVQAKFPEKLEKPASVIAEKEGF